MARWHYQWMVIHQFLPAIVGQATADSVYKEVDGKAPIINIKYYKPRNRTGRPFIPVEFSVAAYRFGHSIARPRYTVQDVATTKGELCPSLACRCLKRPPGQHPERAAPGAPSAEDAVEQVLQRHVAEEPLSYASHCPAGASARRFAERFAVPAAGVGGA